MCLRILGTAGLLLVGLACQQPFPYGRSDLVGDRIAAMTLDRHDGDLFPTAWLIADGQAWAEEPPLLRWFLLPTPSARRDLATLDPLAPPDAEGSAPRLSAPEEPSTLGLVVTFPSGHTARALLDIPPASSAPAPSVLGLQLESLPWDLDPQRTTPDVLEVEARRATATEPAEGVETGAWARLGVRWAEAPPEPWRTRWMTTAGTLLTLDAHQTDWAAASLALDDLTIEDAEPIDAGIVTGLALAQDRTGHNLAVPFDLLVGDAAPSLSVNTRRLPSDADLPPSVRWVQGRLVADDQSPCGLALVDARPADPSTPVQSLPCEGAPAIFHPNLLMTGACGRGDLVGEEVLIERTAVPGWLP